MSDMMQGLQGYGGQFTPQPAQQQYLSGQHMLVDPNQQQMVQMAGQVGQPQYIIQQGSNMFTGLGFDQTQNAMFAGLQGMMPGMAALPQPGQPQPQPQLVQAAAPQPVAAAVAAPQPTATGASGKQIFKGTVKRWNVQKGYGFIEPAPSEGTNDVFVHHTVVHSPGFKSLSVHSEIEYEREPAPGLAGRYRATRVTGPGGVYAKSANSTSGNSGNQSKGNNQQGGQQQQQNNGQQQVQQQQQAQQQQQTQQQQQLLQQQQQVQAQQSQQAQLQAQQQQQAAAAAAAAAAQQQNLMGMGNMQAMGMGGMGQMGPMNVAVAGQLPAGMIAAPQNPNAAAQLGAATTSPTPQQMQLLYMQHIMQPQQAGMQAGVAGGAALATGAGVKP